jgi:hypothetical protein
MHTASGFRGTIWHEQEYLFIYKLPVKIRMGLLHNIDKCNLSFGYLESKLTLYNIVASTIVWIMIFVQ